MSENVLPTFADAMAEWLGANIIILAVASLRLSDGEIVICSFVDHNWLNRDLTPTYPGLNPTRRVPHGFSAVFLYL
jgi:hypothetical protein